jgi:hypothetical protein
MVSFFDETKLYVFSPAGVVTGGSELLHQFVDLVNKNGKEAFIVYYGKGKHVIPDDYKKYDVKLAKQIDDSEKNIVVLYEGVFDRIKEIQHAQIMLWWLSVDLMYHSSIGFLNLWDIFKFSPSLCIKAVIRRVGKLIIRGENEFINNISLKKLKNMQLTNGYQSVYAQHFLYAKGFSELFPLSDYINVDFAKHEKNDKRENIVLYNPKKGIKFTKKLIRANKDIKFVPIKNLTRQGVVELLNSAKVYIDFGFHPGKDRFPREAAISGCVIITGKDGSAYYYEDVAIPSKYKFEAKESNIKAISKKIRNCLDNYEINQKEMLHYCRRIECEKEIFENEVHEFVSN